MRLTWHFTLLATLLPGILSRHVHNKSTTYQLSPHFFSNRAADTSSSPPHSPPSRTRSSHNVIASRQHRERRSLLDVCASVDASLLVDTAKLLGLGDLDVDTNLKLCLCLKDLDIWLDTDANANVLTRILGRGPLKLILQLLLNTSPTAHTCSLPPHSHRICNDQNPCHYECDPGWIRQGDQCICTPPNVPCRGECQQSCPSPRPGNSQSNPPAKRSQSTRRMHRIKLSSSCNINPLLQGRIKSLVQLVVRLRSGSLVGVNERDSARLALTCITLANSSTVQGLLDSVARVATLAVRLRSTLEADTLVADLVSLIVEESLALQTWCATHPILANGGGSIQSRVAIGVSIDLHSLGLGPASTSLNGSSFPPGLSLGPLSINTTLGLDTPILSSNISLGTNSNVALNLGSGSTALVNVTIGNGDLSLSPLLINSSVLFTSGLLSPPLALELSDLVHLVLDTGTLLQGTLISSSVSAGLIAPLLNATSSLLHLASTITINADLLPSIHALVASTTSVRTALLDYDTVNLQLLQGLDAILAWALQLQLSLNISTTSHSSPSSTPSIGVGVQVGANATGLLGSLGLGGVGLSAAIGDLGVGLNVPINSILGDVELNGDVSVATPIPASANLGITGALGDLLDAIVDLRVGGASLLSASGITNTTLSILTGINQLLGVTLNLTASGNVMLGLDVVLHSLSQLSVTLDSNSHLDLDLGVGECEDLMEMVHSCLSVLSDIRIALGECGCSDDRAVIDAVVDVVNERVDGLTVLQL